MDLIARETGRDRAAVRFANLVQPGEPPDFQPGAAHRSRRCFRSFLASS